MNDFELLYRNINVKLALVDLARTRCITNPYDDWVRKLDLPILGRKSKDIKADLARYFDNLISMAQEEAKISLFSYFESRLFDFCRHARQLVFKVVEEADFKSLQVGRVSTNFVKTEKPDFDRIAIIKNMLVSNLDSDSYRQFSEINEHRNFIIHGKRFGSESILSLNEHFEVMEKILSILAFL